MRKLTAIIVACLLGASVAYADPLGTAFTYQGQLSDGGAPANGNYDLKFDLFTTATGGSAVESVELDGQSVSGGLVNASLDFTGMPYNGQALWVEVSVRPAGGGSFTTLSPRQAINATPYALYALNAPGGGAGLTLPFAGSADSSSTAFSVTNTGTGGGIYVHNNGDGFANAALTTSNSSTSGNALYAYGVSPTSAAAVITNDSTSGGDIIEGWNQGDIRFGVDTAGNLTAAGTVSGTGSSNDGVHGTSSTGSGVYGTSSGAGVWGESTGYDGIHGHTSDALGNASGVAGFGDNANNGVFGSSVSGTGGFFISGLNGSFGAAGVYAQLSNDCNDAGSICPYAAVIANNISGGNIFLGKNDSLNVFRVDGMGNVFASTYQTSGADVAEYVPSTQKLDPGDVVAIDDDNGGAFRLATIANSTAVAGVISTQPGLTMNTSEADDKAARGEPRLALTGRVPVKVTAENGAIHPGDLLVSSSVPGHAMRAPANPRPGTVIGKAMQTFDHGNGEIEMLVMLR